MSGWLSKLARPLVVKGGPVLLTLSDVRAFMLDRLPEWHHRRSRQLTAELLLTAAKDPGEIEVVALLPRFDCGRQPPWHRATHPSSRTSDGGQHLVEHFS